MDPSVCNNLPVWNNDTKQLYYSIQYIYINHKTLAHIHTTCSHTPDVSFI